MTAAASLWLRWATSRAAFVREKIRCACGVYNQWPIMLSRDSHHLPIDRLPERPWCTANDNGVGK